LDNKKKPPLEPGTKPPGVKERFMKTYYCVMTGFDDDGTVKASMVSRVCQEKPENTFRELPRKDIYCDWFETEAEAVAFMAEAKAA
jgi:hypothetical protein